MLNSGRPLCDDIILLLSIYIDSLSYFYLFFLRFQKREKTIRGIPGFSTHRSRPVRLMVKYQ